MSLTPRFLQIIDDGLARPVLASIAGLLVLCSLAFGSFAQPVYAAGTIPAAAHFAATAPAPCKDLNCIADRYIDPAIEVMVALVGILVVVGIITAGIQYSASSGDPSKVTAAKQRIYKALTALAALLILWAFLTWLLPGGLST